MKKIIIALSLLTIAMACTNKAQNMNRLSKETVLKHYVGDGYVLTVNGHEPTKVDMCEIQIENKIFDVQKYEYEFYQKAKRLIEKSDFNPLPHSEFRKRILELYNVDIDTVYDYCPNPNSDHSIDIIVHSGFMVLTKGFIDIDLGINEEAIVHYNKMILRDDSISFAWMKANAPHHIIRQVQELGVISNPRWLRFAFDESNFWQGFTLHDYIFGVGQDDEKYHLRKNMLDTLMNYGVDMSLLSSVLESVEYAPEMYADNTNELIGYLYTKLDEAGQCGYIEYCLDNDPELMNTFKNNNYYGSSDLQFFCDEVYETKAERLSKGKGSSLEPEPSFQISDPDGFVNMRKEPNANSEIITTVPHGEFVDVPQTADECMKLSWWKVKYEGKTGYIHKSRIDVLSKNAYLFK